MTPEAKLAFVLRRLADCLEFGLLRVSADGWPVMPTVDDLDSDRWGIEITDYPRYTKFAKAIQAFIDEPGPE
jgi:hypothetical protein